MDEDQVRSMLARGARVNIYTVNDPAEMRRWVAAGVPTAFSPIFPSGWQRYWPKRPGRRPLSQSLPSTGEKQIDENGGAMLRLELWWSGGSCHGGILATLVRALGRISK